MNIQTAATATTADAGDVQAVYEASEDCFRSLDTLIRETLQLMSKSLKPTLVVFSAVGPLANSVTEGLLGELVRVSHLQKEAKLTRVTS